MANNIEKIRVSDVKSAKHWIPTLDANGKLLSVIIPWSDDAYLTARSELVAGAPKMLHFFEHHPEVDMMSQYGGDLSRCELCIGVTFEDFTDDSEATDIPVLYELERILRRGEDDEFWVTYKTKSISVEEFNDKATFTVAMIKRLNAFKQSVEERAAIKADLPGEQEEEVAKDDPVPEKQQLPEPNNEQKVTTASSVPLVLQEPVNDASHASTSSSSLPSTSSSSAVDDQEKKVNQPDEKQKKPDEAGPSATATVSSSSSSPSTSKPNVDQKDSSPPATSFNMAEIQARIDAYAKMHNLPTFKVGSSWSDLEEELMTTDEEETTTDEEDFTIPFGMRFGSDYQPHIYKETPTTIEKYLHGSLVPMLVICKACKGQVKNPTSAYIDGRPRVFCKCNEAKGKKKRNRKPQKADDGDSSDDDLEQQPRKKKMRKSKAKKSAKANLE